MADLKLVAAVGAAYIGIVIARIQGFPMAMLTLPPDATLPRVTDRAFARLAEIAEATGETRALRVAVEGGGCSGFQYDIRLDDAAPDDLVLEKAGMKVLVDAVSLPFLENAVIDFSEELIGARFVIQNPNATSSCGCGTSFSL
jgi:iron-sulfur cluster assembly accessory protein